MIRDLQNVSSYHMRIKNKYIRNRIFRAKHWKRIRSTEHPYRTYDPYNIYSISYTSYEEQIKRHFEDITLQARAIENGRHSGHHATSLFRRNLNREYKAKEKTVLSRIRKGDYDVEFHKFKKDAEWLWF
jgi:hypothetical protein